MKWWTKTDFNLNTVFKVTLHLIRDKRFQIHICKTIRQVCSAMSCSACRIGSNSLFNSNLLLLSPQLYSASQLRSATRLNVHVQHTRSVVGISKLGLFLEKRSDRPSDGSLRDSKARCSVETELNSNDCRSALLSRHIRNAKCRMPFAVVKGRLRKSKTTGRAFYGLNFTNALLIIKYLAHRQMWLDAHTDVWTDSERVTRWEGLLILPRLEWHTRYSGVAFRSEIVRRRYGNTYTGTVCKFQTMMIIDCQGLRQGDVLTRLLIYINRTDNTLKLLN